MKKTLKDSLSEHLALEEGKPLKRCAWFFGFLAVYALILLIGLRILDRYRYGLLIHSYGGAYSFTLVSYAIKAALMIPMAAVLLWFYHTLKKKDAYFCCIILKIAGFTVIFCSILFLLASFMGSGFGQEIKFFMIIGSAICMFIYSIILDSVFLRRSAFIYSLASIGSLVVIAFVSLNISYEYDVSGLFTRIISWASIVLLALASMLGYLLIMIGILRKNKELARMKIISTPPDRFDAHFSEMDENTSN